AGTAPGGRSRMYWSSCATTESVPRPGSGCGPRGLPPCCRRRSRSPREMMEACAMDDEKTRTELEAAAFRALRDRLRSRPDVQNIDMMNLTGFCRNCLSRWYQEAATERGVAMDKDEAREIFYGMPYAEWVA